MIVMLLLTLGLAQECPADLPSITSSTSVVWVSRNNQTVGGKRQLWVTPTSELSGWIRRQTRPTIGDLLRHMGIRKRKSEPRRLYKVVVFDANHASLCRPMEGAAPGTIVSGVPVCEPSLSRAGRQHDGCGRTNDPDGNGATLLRASWTDLSTNGFCVLPAARFVDEAR